MRGDLSTRYGGPDGNFNGVLYQQGRVFLDRDGNAQTAITTEWEDLAGRDVVGAGVLAVPADEPQSFRIDRARLANGEVTLAVGRGRAWADGMLVRLDRNARRLATPLGPPIQAPPGPPAKGDRDAVVLELWRHEVHGFQLPDTLIEAALGGVDTTERVATGMDFRLYRMDANDTCDTIGDKIADDLSAKGTLTVTLQPTVVTGGDCPTVEGGGYTGFEHSLFRIEIAATSAGPRMFKWSQFNGGLVGRGTFDAATKRARITANLAAIATSELTDFYLETVEWDGNRGAWTVTYGAKVSLVNDELVLPATPTFGAVPAAGKTVFFRLWNDIRRISDFPVSANPTELVDGILLQFEPDASGKYAAEDYWTFQVRAGEIGNPTTPLVDGEPPEGLVYHRVPVAVLRWDGSNELALASGTIEDCRRIFQPLTRLTTCCTYRVGDGRVSHGDFTSVQAAVDALPHEGGKVCVLPGTFTEAVRIEGRRNVTVSGCGRRSKVVRAPDQDGPVFHVVSSQGITLEHLAIDADRKGVGVLLEAGRGGLEHVVLDDLFVRAATRSAIECRDGSDVVVDRCVVWMDDFATTSPGIFFVGRDSRLERNTVVVVREDTPPTPGEVFEARGALGGIQLGGGCERVVVRENLIQGGVGNGITLGSVSVRDAETGDWVVVVGWVVNADDPCNPCRPGDTAVPLDEDGDDGPRHVSDGPLVDILFEDNRILDMGLNGIGVIGFFDLESAREIVSVHGLRIVENEIRRCLRRSLAPIRQRFADTVGYGGIALADVSFLEIRENLIEENGPDHLEPVCGIFVLHGEGVEITENRIFGNGAKTREPPSKAKSGPRGGIYVAGCTPPFLDLRVVWESRDRDNIVLTRWNAGLRRVDVGGPALRVHGNRVTAPLGRALTANALGDVSIQGNHFTSFGVEQGERAGAAGAAAATVLVRDLGRASETGGSGSYESVRSHAVRQPAPQPERIVSSVAGEGRLLFTDNQVALQAQEAERSTLMASITILSLGDLGFHDNQCAVELAEGAVLTNVFAYGASVRVSDNRLAEGSANAQLSGMTFGMMNMTTDNQATHCLVIRGWPNLVVKQPNTVLAAATDRSLCERFDALVPFFGPPERR